MKYSFKFMPAVRRAVEILFTSISDPSSSVPNNSPSEYNCFTSENLATTVFNAVPAVSADSRVVSLYPTWFPKPFMLGSGLYHHPIMGASW